MIGRWRLALRIARRSARRAPGRTLLIAALIGLPVMAASWFGIVLASANPSGDTRARQEIGTADASVLVTAYERVRPLTGMMGPQTSTFDVPPHQESAQREPVTVDVASLLPPGSRIARPPSSNGDRVAIKVGDAIGTYPVLVFGPDTSLLAGTYRLDDGRMPTTTTEVALTPSMAKHLGLVDGSKLSRGAAIVTADGNRYPVVGLARPVDRPGERRIWAIAGSKLASTPSGTELSYVVDLPDGANLAVLRRDLAKRGLVLTPRSWIVKPPTEGGIVSSQDTGSDLSVWAAQALVIGFGVLEIVLLAGTAFAVGARRQTRELGLVTSSGGTPADVRRVVLAQGLVLGVIGAAGGVGISVLVAILGRPWWESMMAHLIDDWQFPIRALLAVAAIGVFAGLCAAVVPAITAGRLTPLAALTGRTTVAAGKIRIRWLSVVLVAAGVVLVVVGSSKLATALAEEKRRAATDPTHGDLYGTSPTLPIALVIAGIVAVVVGLVWMLPGLVGKAASIGRALPLSGRLALRDAARHRHRTGPATAAIMMSVGGTAAIAFALANTFAADASNYLPRGYDGDAVVFVGTGQPGAKPYSPTMVAELEDALPARQTFEIADVSRRGAKPITAGGGPPYVPTLSAKVNCPGTPGTCSASYAPLRAVSPRYLERFGDSGTAAAKGLAGGKVVAEPAVEIVKGHLKLLEDNWITLPGPGLPAARVDSLPRTHALSHAVLIDPGAARKLGTLTVVEVHLELTREPTKDELAAAIRIVGSEDVLWIERGYESHANTALIALLGAATVVTLLGVAIAVALSAAEGRADLATLGAIGAPPRRRRSLAAAQAWLIGQLGCLLGVLVGALYAYPSHVTFGSPRFAVPWRELGGIIVAVPLFAALLAWLLTRSRLPMVRRID